MNNTVKSEKFRKLSIAALVTGILGYSLILIFMWFSLTSYFGIDIGRLILNFSIIGIFGIGLPVAAIVCGSIDLSRIKAGRYSNKGRGFDITGIVLGAVFIILFLSLNLGPIFHSVLFS